MATGGVDDLESLKRQLFETTLACQRCIVALDDGVLQKRALSSDRTQSYNALYVQQLQLKVADLEEELNRARQENTQTGMNEGLQARIDKLVMQYKQKIQDVEDEKIRVVAENQRLRMEVSELRKKYQETEEVIFSLTRQREQTSSDQERISMLETQLQIYQEDFESERRDRKMEHDRMVEMEQQVGTLMRQLQMIQRSASFSPQQLRPPTASDNHRQHSAGDRAPMAVHAWPNTMRADAPEDRCDSADEHTGETKTPSDAATEATDAEGCSH